MSEYLIFSCAKCNQYSYVKTSQKTKKCLRCGRNHLVKNIINSGIIVNGITKALEVVKLKQNELAIKDSKGGLNLRSENDFVIKTDIKKNKVLKNNLLIYEELFKKILIEIKNSSIYNSKKGIPEYYVDMISKKYNISLEKVITLKRKFEKIGKLKIVSNKCYIC